jgi:2-hydroxy-3-keto-5-methylthiopentenyl-1-phosphate phosphatase
MNSEPAGVLITDFDGTMTRHDFYLLAIERLLPPNVPDQWAAYRAGEITHFEALRRYFAAIRKSEEQVLDVVRSMELDPKLPAAVNSLHAAGWKVVVTSAGCDWYIRRLLADAGVEIEIHANPGRFVSGEGLVMEKPTGSPFLSPTLGVNKAGVVRHYLDTGRPVAFAGDGYPDADPARLVPGNRRFARGALAEVLRDEKLPFRPFDAWSEIADVLLSQEASR